MKLLLMLQGVLFLCFSSAHPQSSLSDGSSWFGNVRNIKLGSVVSLLILEIDNFLYDGYKTAQQVLESVSEYGKNGMEVAEGLKTSALNAINKFSISNLADKSINAVSTFAYSGLDLGQKLLSRGTETVRSGIAAVLALRNQEIQGIGDSAQQLNNNSLSE